jgi:hypothetical protein
MISESTIQLYELHPPKLQANGLRPTLAELLHEVEVAGKFGIQRDELARQLDLQPELFEAMVNDSGIEIR